MKNAPYSSLNEGVRKRLFEEQEMADLVFHVANETILAHSLIIKSACPVLEELLEGFSSFLDFLVS